MKIRTGSLLLAFGLVLAAAAPAAAAVPHVVQPGETLWSIAAANNFTTRSLAAANGLSERSQVVLGSTVMIPSVPEAAAALGRAGIVPSSPAAGASPAAYLVQPGDTLSGIAAAHGLSTAELAAANGLDPNAFVLYGTTLHVPGAAGATAQGGPPPLGGYKVRPGETLSGI